MTMNRMLLPFVILSIVLLLFGCVEESSDSNGEGVGGDESSVDDLDKEVNQLGEDLGLDDLNDLSRELDELDNLDF